MNGMSNETKTIDITDAQKTILKAMLQRYLPGTAVWAYGSRVAGKARPSSDLDIVAFAEPSQMAEISELREALEESNLPFRVDLFIWEQIPDSFRESIKAQYAVLQ